MQTHFIFVLLSLILSIILTKWLKYYCNVSCSSAIFFPLQGFQLAMIPKYSLMGPFKGHMSIKSSRKYLKVQWKLCAFYLKLEAYRSNVHKWYRNGLTIYQAYLGCLLWLWIIMIFSPKDLINWQYLNLSTFAWSSFKTVF